MFLRQMEKKSLDIKYILLRLKTNQNQIYIWWLQLHVAHAGSYYWVSSKSSGSLIPNALQFPRTHSLTGMQSMTEINPTTDEKNKCFQCLGSEKLYQVHTEDSLVLIKLYEKKYMHIEVVFWIVALPQIVVWCDTIFPCVTLHRSIKGKLLSIKAQIF